MTTVLVKSGEYRNLPVINTQFTLVEGIKHGAKGAYITVKNEGQFPQQIDKVKIKIESADDIEMDGVATTTTVTETDEEAMNRIATRFEILDEMAAACIKGDIRAMIVSGPPGVGKSFGVEQQLDKAS